MMLQNIPENTPILLKVPDIFYKSLISKGSESPYSNINMTIDDKSNLKIYSGNELTSKFAVKINKCVENLQLIRKDGDNFIIKPKILCRGTTQLLEETELFKKIRQQEEKMKDAHLEINIEGKIEPGPKATS